MNVFYQKNNNDDDECDTKCDDTMCAMQYIIMVARI